MTGSKQSEADYERLLRACLPAWLSERLGDSRVLLTGVERLAGGFSNETWQIGCVYGPADSEQTLEFILRWSPEGSMFYPADAVGQYALLEALRPTQIPAPEPIWLELDPSLIGEPFVTMRLLGGTTGPRVFPFNDPHRDEKLAAYVHALSDIHALDWRAFGLGPVLGEPSSAGCAHDALAGVVEHVALRGMVEDKVVKHAIAWLTERLPARSDVTLIHGDPNVSNYRFIGKDVVGVLDWDLARLSDPIWDVAAYCGSITKYLADEPEEVRNTEKSRFLELYADVSGRSLENLDFWRILGALRAASNNSHPAMSTARSPVFWNQLKQLQH